MNVNNRGAAAVDSYYDPAISSIKPLAVSAEEATIPVFDLSIIESATGLTRKKLLADLINAFVTIGFGALYVPHLNAAHERIFNEAHRFFSLNEQTKSKYSTPDSFGYVPFGQEQLRGETIGAERYRYIPEKLTLPQDLGDFSAAVEEIGQEYNQLARRLAALFAEGIGVPGDALPISDKLFTMSIKHYPKPTEDWDGEVVHPHHRDISPITILPAGTEAGLQVLRDGKYQDIVIPEGCVVANTGELLCNKTAGYFYGADHRVVKRGDWPPHGRYQIALFTDFPEDFSLAPFPSLIDEVTREMTPTQRGAFVGQFMTGTEAENFQAYQINVIGEESVTAAKIDDLISKGFLRNPSKRLKEQFPECNWGRAEEANKRLLEEGLTPLFTSSIS